MMRYYSSAIFTAVVGWVLLASAVPVVAEPPENGSEKTLFRWPGADAATDFGKLGTGAINLTPQGDEAPDRNEAKEDEDQDSIVTDRPDFTEASSTVGKGRIQLEAGYTYIRDRGVAGDFDGHSMPEALLRIGMFADWFELRLGQNLTSSRLVSSTGQRERTAGFEDLYVGAKVALTEQHHCLPEMAVILHATLPTGHRDLTADRVLPGISLLYSWEVNDFISIGGSSIASSAVDEADETYLRMAQSLTIGYQLTEKLGAFTEGFAFFTHDGIGVGPEYYLNGGFTYQFTPNFQYDIRAGFGINDRADDFFAGTGFAVRY
jgi:hypothetical protein